MDIEMPVLDGIAATKLLGKKVSNKEVPDIPVVALTAYLDEKDNCIGAGMKEFSKNL